MIYQYFNVPGIMKLTQEILLLNGPKKRGADIRIVGVETLMDSNYPLTVMAIDAEKNGIQLKGSHCSVEKEMVSNPRRIGGLKVNIHLPQSLKAEERKKLEQIALTCPVKESLNTNIQI